MSTARLRCPGCKSPIEVNRDAGPSIVKCSQCGKRLRVGQKTGSGDTSKPATPPKTSKSAPPPEDDEEDFSGSPGFESSDSFDEGQDSSEEQSWTDDDGSSWNDTEQDQWSYDDEQEAAPLPPRQTGRNVRNRPAQSNEPSSFELPPARRDLDSLSEGTYTTTSRFSEEGSAYIRRLLFRAGVLIAIAVVAGYVRSQLRRDGVIPNDTPSTSRLDMLMDSYDYYAGNGETADVPKREAEDIKNLLSKMQVIPVTPPVPKPPSGIRTSWSYVFDTQSPKWNLEVDEGASFEPIAALSKQYSLTPVKGSGQLAILKLPSEFSDLLLLNLESKRSWRRHGEVQPLPITIGQEELDMIEPEYSSDGAYFVQGLIHRSPLQKKWAVSVHKFDNSLVKTFPNADIAQFVSNQRLLVASREEGVRGLRSDSKSAHTLNFWNMETDGLEGNIPVRLGGHWKLSPNRRYLVVVQPDEETSTAVEQLPNKAYEFQSSKVHIDVYETSSAKLLASSEFQHSAVGEMAVMSHDGTRLALVGAGQLLMINMADGKMVATGHLTGDTPEKLARRRAPIRWLVGTDYFQLGELLISVKDGRVLSGPSGNISLPWDVQADRYARKTREEAYSELKRESFDKLFELTAPKETPSVSGPELATLVINGTDSALAKEFLQTFVPQRLKFKSVEESTPDAWHVEMTYSESSGSSSHNLDRWRSIDPWKRKLEQKQQKHLPESQRTIKVQLTLTCKNANGQVICEDSVSADMAPSELNLEAPLDPQFRAVSLMSAINQLKALVPPVAEAPEAVVPEDYPWSEVTPSEKRDPLSGEFTLEHVQVDNTWLDRPHGLPILR